MDRYFKEKSFNPSKRNSNNEEAKTSGLGALAGMVAGGIIGNLLEAESLKKLGKY